MALGSTLVITVGRWVKISGMHGGGNENSIQKMYVLE